VSQAKDFTVSTFGLLIGFFVPGLVGLYGISLWSPQISSVFRLFLTAKSNAGLFLIVLLASLALGLVTSPLRHLLYEQWFRFGPQLDAADFGKLSDTGKLETFRTIVDEHYRYHQFYGHVSLLILPLFAGLVRDQASRSCSGAWIFGISFTAVEVTLIYAARHTYGRYVSRAKIVLQ
jgi:hypothetical protein